MDLQTFAALLADAATSPAMLLVSALLVFVAGISTGWIAHDALHAPEPTDSGDTHARLSQLDTALCPRPHVRAGRSPIPRDCHVAHHSSPPLRVKPAAPPAPPRATTHARH
jgi:hypothetical protein